MENNPQREAEFKKMLDEHDWFYMYSDNPKIYDKGLENEKRLKKIAEEWGTLFVEMYEQRHKKLF